MSSPPNESAAGDSGPPIVPRTADLRSGPERLSLGSLGACPARLLPCSDLHADAILRRYHMIADCHRAEMNRELSPAERALVQWVVEHSAAEPQALLAQIPHLHVVGSCGCGCPTIELALASTPRPQVVGYPVAEAQGHSPEGVLVGVIVFANAGVLTELEIYSITGEGPYSLPSPESLTPVPIE